MEDSGRGGDVDDVVAVFVIVFAVEREHSRIETSRVEYRLGWCR